MFIQGWFLSSLNGHGDWGRAPMAGERQMYQSSEKVESAIQGTAGSSASLLCGKSMEGVLLEHISAQV